MVLSLGALPCENGLSSHTTMVSPDSTDFTNPRSFLSVGAVFCSAGCCCWTAGAGGCDGSAEATLAKGAEAILCLQVVYQGVEKG